MTLLRCSCCGWVHLGRTLAEVEEEVRAFNAFFDQANPETQAMYGGRRPSIEDYRRCFACGVSHTFAAPTLNGPPEGSTLQPMLGPEWT